jgi:hypothetical protein
MFIKSHQSRTGFILYNLFYKVPEAGLFISFFFIYDQSDFFLGKIHSCSSTAVKKVIVQIFNEDDNLTPARIRITNNDTVYFAPEGHLKNFLVSETGGDAMLDNNRLFAYVDGTFIINLPEGNFKFEVIKGYAYSFFDSIFHVSNKTDTIKIKLNKWFTPANNKWYSGDVHLHFLDPATALLEMKAEDLNVANILTFDNSNDNDRFRGAPEPISDSTHIVYINQEFREDFLGHIDLLNLKKLIEPVRPMRVMQYPLNSKACDEAHKQGGHVSWAHFAAWPGLEGPLAIVMKKVDAVELLCQMDPFQDPIFATEAVPDLQMNSGIKIWYRLLNCGLKIPATAGTDKMKNWVTVGANRVYAQVKGDFNYQNWIDAINKGNSFITNSPFLFCTVNNKGHGEEINITPRQTVKIVAEMWSQLPVNRLEIIANGEVIASKAIEKNTHYTKLEIEYKPVKSVWIAARAYELNGGYGTEGVSFKQRRENGALPTLLNKYYGTMRPETVFAHTNPIYVKKAGKPIQSKEDSIFFIEYLDNAISWLQHQGRFPNERAKQEVIKAFQNGKEEFKRIGFIDNAGKP